MSVVTSSYSFRLMFVILSLAGLFSGCGGGGGNSGGSGGKATPLLDTYKLDMVSVNDTVRMGRTEITVAMWKEYCAATGRKMPDSIPTWGWIDNHPMVFVTWYECKAYADWAGLSLPDVNTWVLAAGGSQRNFPWGGFGKRNDDTWDAWDAAKCVSQLRGDTSTAPVGSIPAGNSPLGCADMAGNVGEWTSDGYSEPGVEWKYLRGGGFRYMSPDLYRSQKVIRDTPTSRFSDVGFRLMKW